MHRTRRSGRKGIALLEALVALVILTTVGASTVTMAAEAARDIQRARRTESAMRAANAFFDAVSLWSRDDLDRHLGNRPQGAWLMRVDRPTPTLYIATLTDTATHTELLRTSLFRPESPHVSQ
jgi:type II secretory pathway pseudopilin PulG